MLVETDGLVIKEVPIGENDKLLTVLTKDYGRMNIFAKGAKSVKSHMLSAAQLFSFSHFVLQKRSEHSTISNVELLESFDELRSDIVKLSLANYMAEAAGYFAIEGNDCESIFRLILNCLYALTKLNKPPVIVKTVFEMRLMSASGYMPDLVCCSECSGYESSYWQFQIEDGNLCCENCKPSGKKVTFSNAALSAMRYIIYSQPTKIFAFSVSDSAVKELSEATETYMISHAEKAFASLDFLKSVE
jgi:DNA repair protein RecO (recombination protein O)